MKEKEHIQDERLLSAVCGGGSQSYWVNEVLNYIDNGEESNAVDSFRKSDREDRFSASEHIKITNAFRKKFGHEIYDSKYWTKFFDC